MIQLKNIGTIYPVMKKPRDTMMRNLFKAVQEVNDTDSLPIVTR